jgi:hypothetical protein
VTLSWFGPQNQADFGLSVAPQNRRGEVDVGHTSRSSGLFRVEASLTRVSQSGLKTSGGTWHNHGGCVGCKLKTNGSMRWAASDPATLPLLFSMYYALGE